MWLLSCEGDLFEGKRLWLRPGSTHLLGRTSGKSANGERVQYIDHKSVSRKHLVLQVNSIKVGDSTQLLVKSEVHAVDGSKTGTTIDGERLNNGTRILKGDVHVIKLGSYDTIFTLRWHPVVLSLTTLPKSAKARNEALASYKEKLEHAGVKIATEYVENQTTHLIAKKRNTAAGLQALVQGRWLLTDSFANALADACERKEGDTEDEAAISLLEQDFETFWPREEEHIVPAGGEPIARPSELLKPDAYRAEIFQSMTFVFLSHNQHDQLLPVITSGHGKTNVYPHELGESTTQDVVDFVKNMAGLKTLNSNSINPMTARGKIVVVRSIVKEEGREQDIMRDIEIALNQRSMEQNEFLDVILTNDASALIRPLREASPGDGPEDMDRESTSPRDETTVIESPGRADDAPKRETEPTQESVGASRRRNRRFVTASRFKGFDDFDPSQVDEPKFNPQEGLQPGRESSHPPTVPESGDHEQQRASRKRRAPEDPAEAERRMLDSVAPSTIGPKRLRRQAETSPARASTITREIAKGAAEPTEMLKMDIKAAIKERREKEEERRRLDEEALHNALDIDPSEVRKLVKVEDFDLPVPRRSTSAAPEERSNANLAADPEVDSRRWNPAWTGRQNFKKFRRLRATPSDNSNNGGSNGRRSRGDELAVVTPAAPPRRAKRLVALEEVPRRGLEIEDDYFLEPSSGDRSRSQSQSAPVAKGKGRAKAKAPSTQSRVGRSGGSRSLLSRSTGEDEGGVGEEGDGAVEMEVEGTAEGESRASVDDPHTDRLAFRRRIERSRAEDAETEELGSLIPEEAGRIPSSALGRTPRVMDGRVVPPATATSRATVVPRTQTQTQTLVEDSQAKTTAPGKRPAAEGLRGGPAKKARQGRGAAATSIVGSFAAAGPSSTAGSTRSARHVVSDDDDDDDALKFRRKKR